MIQIKIYNKAFSALTAFNQGEIGALSYKHSLTDIGSCDFILDINNSKVTSANLQNYNKIEVYNGSVVEWVGYIVKKDISLNKVTVRCKSLIGLLKKRLVGDAYTISGNAGTGIQNMLTAINASEDTYIAWGATDIVTAVNLTFGNQDALTVLKKVADVTAGQYIVDTDRKLYFKSVIGDDLSASVSFIYNVVNPELANILAFNVSDDGDDIFTKAYGKSDTLSSTKTNTTLKNKYGTLETYKNFRVANVQADLDALTNNEINDALYSPQLDLSPDVVDNFYVGDIVNIEINNKLVSISGNYQIVEKSIKIVNGQKMITVKINSRTIGVVNKIRDIESRVALLETKL